MKNDESLGSTPPPASADASLSIAGNSISPMVNGESAYPQMIAAIGCANTSISLATYRFDNDTTGNHFCDALLKAVARGVKVCVLVDAVGALHSLPPVFVRFKNTKISARYFTFASGRVRNFLHRYHRRILVIDGHLGFTGGMTIRDSHVVTGGYPKPNQDVHFKLEGPLVSAMQRLFADDWNRVTGESLSGPTWFTTLKCEGIAHARLLAFGPEATGRELEFELCAAIRAARQRINIVTPYFIPSESLMLDLIRASQRNVLVRIFVPRDNFAIVKWASCRHLERLIESECQVLAASPPFDHSKLMTVDTSRALIGSVNWDHRSLFLNAEMILDVHDSHLTTQLTSIIRDKEQRAEPLSLSDVSSISRAARLVGRFAESQL